MTFAIFGKNIDEEFLSHLKSLVGNLQKREIDLFCEEGFANLLQEKYNYSPAFQHIFGKEGLKREEVEILLSIGGDGTFLDSVEYVKNSGVPILGINSGRLGFLAHVSPDEMVKMVEYITTQDYTTETRDLLQLQVDDHMLHFDYALNEIGLLKAATSSLLNIHAYIGGVYLTTYWADGLIVATPTGSTAYSLSGGGPIVSPDCKNLILTPICPHNLSIRPLIVPNDAKITLQVESRSGDFVLSMDSRMQTLSDRKRLTICTHQSKINVVTFPEHNYYEVLRNKLMWGEDVRNMKK